MTTKSQAYAPNSNAMSVVEFGPPSPLARREDDRRDEYLEEKMLATLNRAITVVSDETQALKSEIIVDLRPYSDAKSRVLLDLNKVMAEIGPKELPISVVNELRLLRQALDVNEDLLARHLEAVKEITDLLSATMIKAESDGTYSSRQLEVE